MQSPLCSFDLHRTSAWKFNHASYFIEVEIRNPMDGFYGILDISNHVSESVDGMAVVGLKHGSSAFNRYTSRPCSPNCTVKLRRRTCGGQASTEGFINLLLFALALGNPKCRARRCERANCHAEINQYTDHRPEIFQQIICSQYGNQNVNGGREADCKEQCNKGGVYAAQFQLHVFSACPRGFSVDFGPNEPAFCREASIVVNRQHNDLIRGLPAYMPNTFKYLAWSDIGPDPLGSCSSFDRSILVVTVVSRDHVSARPSDRTVKHWRVHFDIDIRTLALTCRYGAYEQVFRFDQCGIHNAESPDDFVRRCSQIEPYVMLAEEVVCDINAILRSSNLYCTVVREWLHTSNFVDCTFCNCCQRLLLLQKIGRQLFCSAHVIDPFAHICHFVTKRSQSIDHGACSYSCVHKCVCRASSALRRCDVKRGSHCGASAYGSNGIPEIFLCARDDDPHAEHRQKSDCDQQPDERQLRNLPHAFHAFPAIDLEGIVARRWALLRMPLSCAGEGPFLHRDAFLRPRRINVISRFV